MSVTDFYWPNDCISQDPTASAGLGYFPRTGRAGFYCFHRCYKEEETECKSVKPVKPDDRKRQVKAAGGGKRADCVNEEQVDWTATWITDKCLLKVYFALLFPEEDG